MGLKGSQFIRVFGFQRCVTVAHASPHAFFNRPIIEAGSFFLPACSFSILCLWVTAFSGCPESPGFGAPASSTSAVAAMSVKGSTQIQYGPIGQFNPTEMPQGNPMLIEYEFAPRTKAAALSGVRRIFAILRM
jgi:hypothetical protein